MYTQYLLLHQVTQFEYHEHQQHVHFGKWLATTLGDVLSNTHLHLASRNPEYRTFPSTTVEGPTAKTRHHLHQSHHRRIHLQPHQNAW